MLKLIKCEFWKLKRRKFVVFTMLFSAVFPVFLSFSLPMLNADGTYGSTKRLLYDTFWQMVTGYGITFLMPCIIGVLSAILFFMERDNGTFKNLRTIPVTSTRMIFAKIAVLFILAIVFCTLSTLFSAFAGMLMPQSFAVSGLAYKFLMSAVMGILITLGSMPLVLLVAFFSKNYLFSVMLAIFYTVFSFLTCFGALGLPKLVVWCLPTPCILMWSVYKMASQMQLPAAKALAAFVERGLIPSTGQMLLPLCIIGTACIALVIHLYKRRGE